MNGSRPARTYLLHGLRVRSEIALDGPEADDRTHDLAIAVGEVRPVPDAPPGGRLLARLDLPVGSSSLAVQDGHYVLRVHRYCDFALSDRLEGIRVHLAPERDEEHASLLLGGVIATVLTLRGYSVLHASAVEVSGRAIAIAAGSGMGKTTLAALCCAAGARLVTDDVLRVETAHGQGWCHRGSSELRVRAAVAELAESLPGAARRSTVDERYAAQPPAAASTRLPLFAVVAPRFDPATDEPRIDRVYGAAAVRELVSFPRTLGWTDSDAARRDFAVLADIAGLVPVYRATLPQKLDPGLAESLLSGVGLPLGDPLGSAAPDAARERDEDSRLTGPRAIGA